MSAKKYKPELCDELINHMSKGYSFESFAGVINVTRSLLYIWLDEYPEFKEAKEIAFAKRALFAEEQMINQAMGRTTGGSPALLKLLLCNLGKGFAITDKNITEQTVKSEINIVPVFGQEDDE